MRSQLDELFRSYLRTRDPDLLAAVFEQTFGAVLAQARRIVGDPMLAEDLLQDTFLTLIAGADSFRHDGRCVPYVIGIVTRKAQRARVDRDDRSLETRGLLSRALGPYEHLRQSELTRAVATALGDVPSPYDVVLRLYLLEGRAPQEIGRILRRPANRVRVQIHRGLRILRRLLPPSLAGAVLLVSSLRAAGRSGAIAKAAGRRTGLRIGAALVVLALGATVVVGEADVIRARVLADEGRTPTAAVPSAGEPEDYDRAPAHAAQTTGALVLRMRWKTDGAPAAHVGVRVLLPGHDVDFGAMRAVSGNDGLVRVDHLPPGEVSVEADRGARTSMEIRAGRDNELAWALDDRVTVVGQVVDKLGQPVSGAGIWLCDRPRHPWQGQVVCTTDASGSFRLRGLHPMSVLAACTTEDEPSPVQAVGQRSRIVLAMGGPAAKLSGRVVDARGAPVRDAQVLVGLFPRAEQIPAGTSLADLPPTRRVRTDASGKFSLRGLPRGEMSLVVRARDFVASASDLSLHGGWNEPRLVRLRHGTSLAGVVRDTDGSPVARAWVQVDGEERCQWAGAWTAGDGSFTLEGLAPERRLASVQAPGYRPVRELLSPAASRFCPQLESVTTTRGRLVDCTGEPMDARDWQLVRTEGPVACQRQFEVRLADDGRFAIDARASRSLWARRGDELVWQRCRTRNAGRGTLIALAPPNRKGGWILARVVGCSTAALADAIPVAMQAGWTYRFPGGIDASSGELRIGPLAPGTYRVAIRASSGRFPPLELGCHEVGEDEEHRLPDVLVSTGTLRYSIVRSDGLPIRQLVARVTAEDGSSLVLQRFTGEQALAPGSYRLDVWGGRFAPRTIDGIEIEAGCTANRRLELQPARVRQIVFRVDQPHALTVGCRLLDDAGIVTASGTLRPEPDGRCTFRRPLPSGCYSLEVTCSGRTLHGSFFLSDLERSSALIRVSLGR